MGTKIPLSHPRCFILGTLGWPETCTVGPGTQAAPRIQGKLFHGVLVAIKTAQRLRAGVGGSEFLTCER